MSKSGLSERSMTAFIWGAGGAVVRMVMQFTTQIIIARSLGPSEYGVFSIGLIAVTFSMFFADVGLATGLVQRTEVSNRDIRFVFTWQIIVGACVATVVALLARGIGDFFNEVRAIPVVAALSSLCLINALAAPANNLLRRDLNQKSLQKAGLISYFLGFVCVGIPLSIIYKSVWALVAAWVIQASVAAALAYSYTRHPVRPLIWHESARSQGLYGMTVFLTNIVNWFVNNIDRLVIGRTLSTRDIGLYGQSYNFYYSPTASVMGILYQVLFAAASRVSEGERRKHLSSANLGVSAGIVLIFLPLFSCVAVAAPTVVQVLYGPAWIEAADLFLPLSLAMIPWMLYGVCTPLLWVVGKKTDELSSQLPLALAWALGCYLACQSYGVVGVAWSLLIFMSIRWLTVARQVWENVGIKFLDFWVAVRHGVHISIVCFACVGLLNGMLPILNPILRLLILTGAGTAAFVVANIATARQIDPSLRVILRKLSNRLPRFARDALDKFGFI